MTVPYQCIVARSSESSDDWTVFAASGSKIVVQSSRGSVTTWPQQDAQTEDQQEGDSEERPGKRIKLEQPKEQKSNFASLIFSNDGQYLVGITGEDKCVRVFQIDAQNRLHQLSERRPCSITLTSDDATILCADKFGDVYALPLLPSPDDDKEEELPEALATEEADEKEWIPSATTLTVHSGRNRKTLEEQLKRKAKGPAKPKETMRFKHELLLGHVSMLTDVVYAQADRRGYIMTADRDEHIRISRGPPQAHIIEGFCFGHEAFVSRLCLTQSGLLVSGGGDDHLFVWDWQNYLLKEKLAIRDLAFTHLQERGMIPAGVNVATYKVAVSGIWNLPSKDGAETVVVACEGVPALFSFRLGASVPGYAIPLDGNALDLAIIRTSTGPLKLAVSIDNIQKPGSTTEVREDTAPRLQYFARQQDGTWHADAELAETLKSFEQGGDDRLADDKAVRDMLYNVENLRKRPGAED
ncbi:tRNA (guanine-N(7)-)-methyltransferase non-catalytic subunit trm82 [Alternaria infectoria]|uniref:tRNA (guanine-N(7)-)-methyltransferase non-catalytic subunit trm82 n=1 Tax=Alternaria infectoria TaxID=45303 RepID=UPI00221FC8CB|nr:tRNA (guanine-N(7)-)-methyltransferase non-catalytic subunit trm82 [Alternaria infectoria]KAI4918983.1 tRNA (guanine-N(7)-)-methyltransferase non-catalytic subunit trm82 [Alternaria infectoria]